MSIEVLYSKSVGQKHLKEYGQYFTNCDIADFMTKWACRNASNMLDPAVGNSIFLKYARSYYPECELTGYELDNKIIDFFGNPAAANIINGDYLKSDWNTLYDAIVCNPPYNRFQSISNRDEIIQSIYEHTGIKYSGYTNLYILFLIKSIHQLSDKGRLAYIIPTEFFNSKYGTSIKKMLLEKRLIRAIINFQNNADMFFNATTTCCILLLDHSPKEYVYFYNLSSIDEIKTLIIGKNAGHQDSIKYSGLKAEEKWRSYLNQERKQKYTNLRDISDFCYVSRGIATGANEYFCFCKSKISKFKIPEKCIVNCICRSADIKTPVFTEDDFLRLANSDKTVYLLDASEKDSKELEEYISYGVENGVNKKYLPSCRKPWFSMEQKPAAPIWVSSACRDKVKFIRNLANAKSLTTFHSIFINKGYEEYTDLIFCYFLTPIAQRIIKENRKELGNGLDKFQPNDLNTAKMLDITLIIEEDKKAILRIYHEMKNQYTQKQIAVLNDIFIKYVIEQPQKESEDL